MMLTNPRLHEMLLYDGSTGDFTWRVRRGKAHVGSQAGSLTRNGCGGTYRHIKVDGRLYKSHRLAWLYVYGRWPEADIDHIDGDGTNNRIANLREATRSQNCRNKSKQSNNKSGFKGVHWCANERKWRALIYVGGQKKSLGMFKTAEAAHEAYAAAAQQYHGEYARFG
jgi:hypothetical protein